MIESGDMQRAKTSVTPRYDPVIVVNQQEIRFQMPQFDGDSPEVRTDFRIVRTDNVRQSLRLSGASVSIRVKSAGGESRQ